MRIGVVLVSLALLAQPALVRAAERSRSEQVPLKPSAKRTPPVGLRGPVPAGPVAIQPAPTGFAASPPGPLSALSVGAQPDPRQCRTDCAHAYYSCPLDATATDCAETWSQCEVDCAHPPPTLDR